MLTNILLSPDGAQGGSGKTTTNSKVGDQTEAFAGTSDSGAKSQDKGDSQKTTGGADTSVQDELNKLKANYDNLLTVHNEMKAKTERREEEQRRATERSMQEQGKFKELYEAQTKELETLRPTVGQYEKAIQSYLDSELKELSPHLKDLIPEGNVLTRLEWVTKAKKAGVISPTAKGDGAPPPSRDKPISSWTSIYKRG